MLLHQANVSKTRWTSFLLAATAKGKIHCQSLKDPQLNTSWRSRTLIFTLSSSSTRRCVLIITGLPNLQGITLVKTLGRSRSARVFIYSSETERHCCYRGLLFEGYSSWSSEVLIVNSCNFRLIFLWNSRSCWWWALSFKEIRDYI